MDHCFRCKIWRKYFFLRISHTQSVYVRSVGFLFFYFAEIFYGLVSFTFRLFGYPRSEKRMHPHQCSRICVFALGCPNWTPSFWKWWVPTNFNGSELVRPLPWHLTLGRGFAHYTRPGLQECPQLPHCESGVSASHCESNTATDARKSNYYCDQNPIIAKHQLSELNGTQINK